MAESTTTNLAERYDAVVYPGLAVPRTQPDFLAAVARLRGMRPAAASTARVLELGCAAGQNLLPLAERHRKATFVGVDLSANQIERGRRAASELGLANVELRHQNLLELDAALGPFDYIIAQGLYSKVEEAVREKILSICAAHLAPEGVALVSYKAYPGWEVQESFRELMLFNGRHAATPAERIQRGRKTLNFFKDCFARGSARDRLVQEELAPLLKLNDAYLWHDHLAPVSHPVLFRRFMAHAGQHGLQLLGDAVLGIRTTDVLDSESERQLASLTSDPLEAEQLRDVLRNRSQRQTLLCHADAQLQPIAAERLEGLYLSGDLTPEDPFDLVSDKPSHFLTGEGARLGTPLPLVKAAIAHLGQMWPASVRTEDLLEAASRRLVEAGQETPSAEAIRRAREGLLQCVAGEVVDVHSEPDAFAAQVSDRPVGSPLARWQARRSSIVTNRRHVPVEFDVFHRYVLGLLDGARDTSALIAGLQAAAERSELAVASPSGSNLSPAEMRQVFADALPEALDRLAKHAMLVA